MNEANSADPVFLDARSRSFRDFDKCGADWVRERIAKGWYSKQTSMWAQEWLNNHSSTISHATQGSPGNVVSMLLQKACSASEMTLAQRFLSTAGISVLSVLLVLAAWTIIELVSA